VLAGGTDLLVQMRGWSPDPILVVDVKRIPELTRIELTSSGLRVGAAVCAAAINEHPGLVDAYPGLAEAADLIGSSQIQGRASLGGNLCNASPAADSVPALLTLGAECAIAGPKGERTVPIERFVTGPGTNCLATGELLVELRFAAPAQHSADAYLRLIPRTEMDIAVAGAGACVTLDGEGRCSAARIAIGAVGPRAIVVPDAGSALVGTTLDAAALDAAAAAASAAASPIDDKRGTVKYRRRVVGVLAKRAAQKAAERARRRG